MQGRPQEGVIGSVNPYSSKSCLWPKIDTECLHISLGTHFKIIIFGSHPVTGANVNNKKYFSYLFKHDENYKYSHFFHF